MDPAQLASQATQSIQNANAAAGHAYGPLGTIIAAILTLGFILMVAAAVVLWRAREADRRSFDLRQEKWLELSGLQATAMQLIVQRIDSCSADGARHIDDRVMPVLQNIQTTLATMSAVQQHKHG
jgi:hypothetical protein